METLFSDVNMWAVLVSAVASFVLGAVWYSPFVFGKTYTRLMGWSHETMEHHKKGAVKGYVITFISSLVMAYVLSFALDYTVSATITDGLKTAFALWLGFVATVSIGSVLWEGKPFALYLINAAFNLISMGVMAAILTVWI